MPRIPKCADLAQASIDSFGRIIDLDHPFRRFEYKEKKKGTSQLVHYHWKAKTGFETPSVILEADKVNFDVASDRGADLLAVVYSTDAGVFLLAYERNEWQRSPLLPEKLKGRHNVEIESIGDRQFRIRATGEENIQIEAKIGNR